MGFLVSFVCVCVCCWLFVCWGFTRKEPFALFRMDAATFEKFLRHRLMEAAKQGKASVVEELVQSGLSPDVCGKSGRTALHYAAREGCLKVCQVLVEAGANVNAENKWKEAPLHAAAYNAHPDVCEYLLSVGAKIDAMNDQGHTSLDLARAAQKRGKFKKSSAQTIEVLNKKLVK